MKDESAEKLDLSVIIATCNRARGLESTLNHLMKQDVEGLKWEVIVVDNGSTDDTAEVLKRASQHLPVVSIYEPESGKNRALNRALDVARGELYVFTDDDVKPSDGWLSQLIRASRRYVKYSIFCGPIIPEYPDGMPDWMREHPFSIVAFGNWSYPEPEGPLAQTPCGANYALKAKVVGDLRFRLDLGPQAKSAPMGDETEFIHRLLERGERVIYVPTATISHHVHKNQTEMKWLLARAFRHGRGLARIVPDEDSFRLLGVPAYLWLRVPMALGRFWLSYLRNARDRFEWGIRLYRDWGQLYEYRLGISDPRQTDSSPSS
jgi:glycosyltransferase involved in cell wall biosynthesis